MEKISTAMSVYGTRASASSLAATSDLSEFSGGIGRQRGVVNADMVVRGGGELCPQAGVFAGVVRDADLPIPFPGTAVSGGPPA